MAVRDLSHVKIDPRDVMGGDWTVRLARQVTEVTIITLPRTSRVMERKIHKLRHLVRRTQSIISSPHYTSPLAGIIKII